jgi:hypothetical protein
VVDFEDPDLFLVRRESSLLERKEKAPGTNIVTFRKVTIPELWTELTLKKLEMVGMNNGEESGGRIAFVAFDFTACEKRRS